MTILVFGKNGQVARELQAQAPVLAIGREEADFTNVAACLDALETYAPRMVINAAAYTAVDRAEDEEKVATLINGSAPAGISRACANRNIPFVHISTDYVFDGAGSLPWKPSDVASPISAYGRSKLAGEKAIIENGGQFAIFRTSWVFSAYGQNFVKTILRLGVERDHLHIVSDQIGGPTSARSIALACLSIAEQIADVPAKAGIYHFAGTPSLSWAEFAREIIAEAGLDCQVSGIPSRDYKTAAKRPHNSRLDCTSTEAVFGIACPDWREDLRRVLKQISEKGDLS